VFGLVLGSFLNVVIWRVPRGESLIHPGSACTSCGAPVAARDNVPVLSWMLLLGQARCCGAAISVRYPLVELVTAVFLAGLAVWTGPAWRLLAFAYLAALSIVLAVIDVDVKRLPYWLVAPSYPVGAVLLGIASLGEQDLSGMVRALIGAAALWSFYTVLHLVYPPGMAYGDVRLAGVLGLYLVGLGPPGRGRVPGFSGRRARQRRRARAAPGLTEDADPVRAVHAARRLARHPVRARCRRRVPADGGTAVAGSLRRDPHPPSPPCMDPSPVWAKRFPVRLKAVAHPPDLASWTLLTRRVCLRREEGPWRDAQPSDWTSERRWSGPSSCPSAVRA